MSEQEILEDLREIMKENELVDDESKITLETNIKQDLDADSLDFVDLIIELEDKYQISIDDEASQEFVTVKDVIDYILKMKE